MILRHLAKHTVPIAGLCMAFLAFIPHAAIAQEVSISINAIQIFEVTPDSVAVQLSGTREGIEGQLCLDVVAKSSDGIVRSAEISTDPILATGKFQVTTQVRRPRTGAQQQTDLLLAVVHPCWQEHVILQRKFAWHHVWPEQNSDDADGKRIDSDLGGYLLQEGISGNFKEEDFPALDMLMDKWNNPDERDQSGEWKLDMFRTLFVNYSSNERDWKGDLERIRRWRTFNPKSAGAVIAEAKYWIAYAWHIRGNQYAVQDDPVALSVFDERMRRAEQVLKDARDFAAGNPLWYEAYLDIAVTTRRDKKFVDELFNEAIRRHPYFLSLYLDMARYWAPYSGENADWHKADEVIREAVSNTEKKDGMGNYAMLYAQLGKMQKCECDLFRDSQVSWDMMRSSFEDLVKRYPSRENLNEFAAFACQANDKKTFLNIRPQIVNRILPDKWPGNYSYDLCDHRFMQET